MWGLLDGSRHAKLHLYVSTSQPTTPKVEVWHHLVKICVRNSFRHSLKFFYPLVSGTSTAAERDLLSRAPRLHTRHHLLRFLVMGFHTAPLPLTPEKRSDDPEAWHPNAWGQCLHPEPKCNDVCILNLGYPSPVISSPKIRRQDRWQHHHPRLHSFALQYTHRILSPRPKA